jgi:N-acetylmuramoyl-L-alanine amidase
VIKLNKIRIGVDGGHGIPDTENRGPTGYIEADGNLDMAIACMNELINHGIEVVMTRNTDKGLSIRDRAKILNNAVVDLSVSIHSNACGDPKVRGVECIHSIHPGSKGRLIARFIYDRLQKDLNIPGRRIFSRESETNPGTDYYGMIRETERPCVIVEVEFHSNPEAEKLLKDPAFRKRAGISIARAIMDYLGIKYKEVSQ